jgi:hypothetical protein
MTLGIQGPDRLDIGDWVVKIEQVRIDYKLNRSHDLSLDLSTFGFAGFGVRRAFAVVRLLQFVVWFCHRICC